MPLLRGDKSIILEEYQRLKQPMIIKLKVAKNSVATDILIFNQLCTLMPDIQIRLDANQQRSKKQASDFLTTINVTNIDYLEEATASHRDNLQLARAFNIKIALDETLQTRGLEIFSANVEPEIKALVIKPTLIGSLAKIDRLMTMAKRDNLSVNISSSFESAVGLSLLKEISADYAQEVSITLGIDTQKQFASDFMMRDENLTRDIATLECVWTM